MKRASQLPGNGGCRIGVLPKVGSEHHSFAEIRRLADTPESSLKRADNIARTADF